MDLNKLSVNKLRTELWTCHILCEQRCLRKACELAEDLLYSLPEEGEEKLLSKLENDLNDITDVFNPRYEHAKACFQMHEYDRAAHLIRNYGDDDKSRFLHYFSMYKAAEKKRIDLMNEVSVNIPKKAFLKFNELRDSIERSMERREPDGWLLYVYGLVLVKFKLHKKAIDVIEKAINSTPINLSAWYILTQLVDSKKQLYSLNLPKHLFKVFFYYIMRLNLYNEPENYERNKKQQSSSSRSTNETNSDKETRNFLDKYFKNSLFVSTLRARFQSYQSHQSEASHVFAQIRSEDPYRVDSMDVYSNSLYVLTRRKQLAKLAYDMERIDPFTPEANTCIANSFAARDQHNKAIVYFTRALRLNPDHPNLWALIGHEYLELKSIDKAIQAYRYAISINKRDCRAWLGLGNTYETIMSSPNVTHPNYEPCLYYYSQVGKYRPTDFHMYQALEGIFAKMGLNFQASACMKLYTKELTACVEACRSSDDSKDGTTA